MGGNYFPKKCNFWYFLPYFLQFLPLNLQIFAIFPKKMLILTIFSQKKCNFEKFSTSESEIYGESFSLNKNSLRTKFFWRNIHLCHLVIEINFLQSITCWCQWGWKIVPMFTVPHLRQHQHLWVRGSLHCGKECSPLSQWSRKQTQLHWPSSWRPRGIKISRHSEHVEYFLELT